MTRHGDIFRQWRARVREAFFVEHGGPEGEVFPRGNVVVDFECLDLLCRDLAAQRAVVNRGDRSTRAPGEVQGDAIEVSPWIGIARHPRVVVITILHPPPITRLVAEARGTALQLLIEKAKLQVTDIHAGRDDAVAAWADHDVRVQV